MTEEQQYEAKMEEIERIFPNAKFSICFELDELSEIVSDKEVIIIKLTHTCYCYDDCPRQNEYIVVRNEGSGITIKMMIDALIREGYDPECNHHFLELFTKINDVSFLACFGS